MIDLCPFCGHRLYQALGDGIATCNNCSRVFDSCPLNRLLSAGWVVRKKNYDDPQDLVREGFTEEEAYVAICFVYENEYSPDEYLKALRSLGVSEKYTPRLNDDAA